MKHLASIAPIDNFNLPENDLPQFDTAEKNLSKTDPTFYQSDQPEPPFIAPINNDNLIKSIKMHTHDSSDNQAMMGKLLNEKWKKDLGMTLELLLL